MSTEKYGIENLKLLLDFIFKDLGSTLTIDKNHNGKISFTEILSVATTLSFKFPSLYETFPFLKKEFKDLSDAEIEELRKFVNTLDLPDEYDNIEEIIKLTVNALNYNYRYIKKMKKYLKL